MARNIKSAKLLIAFSLLIVGVSARAQETSVAWLAGPMMEIPAAVMAQTGMQPMYARHHQGYLGVDIRDVTDDQLGFLKLPAARGAEIIMVDHDAPAGKVGLREHDVVLQVDGAAIDNAEQFRRIMHDTPSGRTVSLVISRDGQQQTISVQLANREEVERRAWEGHYVPNPPPGEENDQQQPPPPPPGGNGVRGNGFAGGGMPGGGFGGFNFPTEGPHPTYTGAMLEPVGQLADFFGVKPGIGLLIKNIDANSPAASAGLKPGDVITRVNAKDVLRPDDWFRAVRDSKGRSLQLTIVRNKQEQTVSLTPADYHRTHSLLEELPLLLDNNDLEGLNALLDENMSVQFAQMQQELNQLEEQIGTPYQ